MRDIVLMIVFVVVFLAVLGLPWRFLLFPALKGVSGILFWILNIIILVVMVGVAIWAARFVVSLFGGA